MDYALDRRPAFYDCLLAFLPLRVSRGRDNERFNAEMECGFIVKAHRDTETFVVGEHFHGANNLAFDFGEVLSGGCTLGVSQFAPPSASWSGLAFGLIHRALARLFSWLRVHEDQAKRANFKVQGASLKVRL